MEFIKLFTDDSEYSAFTANTTDDAWLPNVSHCITESHVHYNPYIDPYNGHAYVDLGLTSGTLWAKKNVGANVETDYGLYFAWGETQGYADASTKAFSWNDYALTEDSGSTFTKYNSTDGLTHLELSDDAAAVNMGGDWHMPNKAQCIELFKETTNGFVTSGGVFTQFAWSDSNGYSSPTETTASTNWNTAGYFFFKNTYTSVTDAITAEDYLFVPAAGGCFEGSSNGVGEFGSFWSSFLYESYVGRAWSLGFDSGNSGAGYYYRSIGVSLRGVVGNLIYIERINNGVYQNSDIVWDGDSTTISVTLSDAVTADNVQISMSQSNYNGEATATSIDGKTWTATINTKSGWSNFRETTVRIWSDSFDYSTNIQANLMD